MIPVPEVQDAEDPLTLLLLQQDDSRGTSSWRLCWSTGRTRMSQPGCIRQSGATCTNLHDPIINHSPQPMVTEIFKTES